MKKARYDADHVEALHEDAHIEAIVKDDYVSTFGPRCGPGAERVLQDLYQECGMMQRSFVPGDPHHTSYNEGLRSVMIHILEMTFGAKGARVKIQAIETDYAKEQAA